MSAILLILKLMAAAATFAVMFGTALRLGPESLRALREHPAMFLRTLVAVWIGVPALTALVIVSFRVTGLSAATLMLMAFCPGIPLLLAATKTVRGAVSTAFVALLITAMTEPLLIPYGTRLMSMALPIQLQVHPWHVLEVLLPAVFLPVALAFAVRWLWLPIANTLARASDVVYAVGVIGSVGIVVIHATPRLLEIPPRAFIAALLITLGDALLGYWAGKPDREDQKALALATALGNPALALAVVEASYPGFPALTLVSLYLVVRGIALVPFEWWLKRARQRPRPA